MRNAILLIYSVLLSFACSAQKESDNWLFGNGAWINFSAGNPVAVASPSSAMLVNEGCASFSDTSGNLMFYTNGLTIWNSNHTPMPNGQNLHGDNSSTQSAIVVPKPGTAYGTFYVFTVDAQGDTGGLKYSVIDMSLNGGLGDVTLKNIPLIAPTCEKVTAVRHGSSVNDFWIITHEWNSNRFFAFLVNASGVSSVPVISAVGDVHALDTVVFPGFSHIQSHGYLKASPDGSRIASAVPGPLNSRVEIFDFDNLTGVISNPVKLSGFRDPYGIEFSPSGQYLYCALSHINDTVFQFDVTSPSIASTKQAVGTTAGVFLGGMQMANNGKIYICKLDNTSLASIDNPNAAGSACNFNLSAVTLNNNCKQGLPNFFTNVFLNADYVYEDTCYNAATKFMVTYSGADSVIWNFGDPASGVLNTESGDTAEHVFTSVGQFIVECIVFDLGLVDTVLKTVEINPLPDVTLGNDTAVCNNNEIWLAATSTNATSYMWDDLSTNDSLLYTAVTAGTYIKWVDAFLNGCSMRDSIEITVDDAPLLNLGADTILCGVSQYLLDANAAGNTNITSYLWQDGSNLQTLTVNTSGLYIVTISRNNCSVTDSIDIQMNPLPDVQLGNDLSLCSGEDQWIAVITNASSVLWYDGNTSDSILFVATTPGMFDVYVTGFLLGCEATDTLSVAVSQMPSAINLGPDTSACEGETIILNAGVQGVWQDGTVASAYNVTLPGTYYVLINQGGCSVSDTVNVSFDEAPSLFASADTTICEDDIIILDLSSNPPGYLFQWSDGFPDPIRVITTDGIYTATVSIGDCSASSTYIVHSITEPLIYLGEDSVLCAGGSWVLDATFPYSTYLWQDGSTEPTLTTTSTSTYGVQVTNQCGVFVDSISLEYVECRCNIFFPSAFTPNKDSKNEIFNYKYECNEFIPELSIYNRWGMLMFTSNDPHLGWDGNYNGKEAVADAYIYVVKYLGVIDGTIQEQEKRGTFILIR